MRSIQVLIACVRCFSISAHSISCAQPSTHPWHSDSRCCVRLTWVSSALIRLRVRGGRAGSAAGMVSQTIIYPMEVLKTRLALSQGGPYSSMASCLRTTVHNEGFGALYKGLAASNLGMIPYAGVDLAVYGTLKAEWKRRNPDSEPKWYHLLLMGSTSSFTGQVIAYPLQLVRTRLQSSGLPGREVGRAGLLFVFSRDFGRSHRDCVVAHVQSGKYLIV
eukprot:m.583104 g.583104  ORF g.583104 m.583104 type:complete len:219 (-) comp22338_c0_seq29:1092-1748(-)